MALALEEFAPNLPLVVDPVMVAKGGHPLLAREAVTALKGRLIKRATVITPNLPEAETLLERKVRTLKDMEAAADDLLALGPKAVLLKGGHLSAEDKLVDLLITSAGVTRFEGERVATTSTHGTGCTLASAVATGLAQNRDLIAAVSRARDYVLGAIRSAPGYGKGHGPLDHSHTVRPVRASLTIIPLATRPMTEELFREESYLKDCAATVTHVADGAVVLDRTVFYPMGGGQPGRQRCLDLVGWERRVHHGYAQG